MLKSDKCIFAHTADGSDYPDFVNLSRTQGRYILMLRSGGREDEQYASIELTEEQLGELEASLAELRQKPPPRS